MRDPSQTRTQCDPPPHIQNKNNRKQKLIIGHRGKKQFLRGKKSIPIKMLNELLGCKVKLYEKVVSVFQRICILIIK